MAAELTREDAEKLLNENHPQALRMYLGENYREHPLYEGVVTSVQTGRGSLQAVWDLGDLPPENARARELAPTPIKTPALVPASAPMA